MLLSVAAVTWGLVSICAAAVIPQHSLLGQSHPRTASKLDDHVHVSVGNEAGTSRIPTVQDSAVLARRLLHLSRFGTLSTVFPSDAESTHGRPAEIKTGTPIGLPEYVADCEPEQRGNPTLLAFKISTSFRNAAVEGANVSLSLNWGWRSDVESTSHVDDTNEGNAYGGRHVSLASLPRVALVGYIERIAGRARASSPGSGQGPAIGPDGDSAVALPAAESGRDTDNRRGWARRWEEAEAGTERQAGPGASGGVAGGGVGGSGGDYIERVARCYLAGHGDARAWLPDSPDSDNQPIYQATTQAIFDCNSTNETITTRANAIAEAADAAADAAVYDDADADADGRDDCDGTDGVTSMSRLGRNDQGRRSTKVHDTYWARLVVRQVFWVGGFGDRAYIGWIPLPDWQGVTLHDIGRVKLPGER